MDRRTIFSENASQFAKDDTTIIFNGYADNELEVITTTEDGKEIIVKMKKPESISFKEYVNSNDFKEILKEATAEILRNKPHTFPHTIKIETKQ